IEEIPMTATSKLSVTTPSDLQIVMTRSFDAPRRLVWEAMTKPALVQRWMFVPPGWSWATCDMDVRIGGKFRWAWNGPDGNIALIIWGEHREITPPSRIVHTEHMEMPQGGSCGGEAPPSDPDCEVLVTVDLTEQHG